MSRQAGCRLCLGKTVSAASCGLLGLVMAGQMYRSAACRPCKVICGSCQGAPPASRLAGLSQVGGGAETFAAWKARWDAESALSQAKLEADAAVRSAGPTGKQWFQQQEATGVAEEEGSQVNAVRHFAPIWQVSSTSLLSLHAHAEELSDCATESAKYVLVTEATLPAEMSPWPALQHLWDRLSSAIDNREYVPGGAGRGGERHRVQPR